MTMRIIAICATLFLAGCGPSDFDKGDEVLAVVSRVQGSPCKVTITSAGRGKIQATVATIDGCLP
jgi:hypothetical protein